jgi:hypothetical protein
MCYSEKMKNTASAMPSASRAEFTLGRERFEKFSAVEGIFLTLQEKRMFDEMDSKQLSNEERRLIILAHFKESV